MDEKLAETKDKKRQAQVTVTGESKEGQLGCSEEAEDRGQVAGKVDDNRRESRTGI